MNYNVKKRAQRSDDSILLRHMDGVVGTCPEEHLMSDFEHMKTSLYLTDVVVLRHNGDTVNFLGVEITKTRKGFEVKNSTDLIESLLNLYGLQNSKPTVNLGRRSTVMELASATPLDGHDYSNFRTAVGKLIFTASWRPDMQFAIQQLSTQVLHPTTESKLAGRAVPVALCPIFSACGWEPFPTTMDPHIAPAFSCFTTSSASHAAMVAHSRTHPFDAFVLPFSCPQRSTSLLACV